MSESTSTGKPSFKASAKIKASKLALELKGENLGPLLRPLVEKAQPFVDRADQVLLGLSHSKESIPALLKQTLQAIEKNPNDIVGRVSRSVLERAETVRKQLIEKAQDSELRFNKRWVPEWVKEVSFAPTVQDAKGAPTVQDIKGSPAAQDAESLSAASIDVSAPKAAAKKSPATKAKKPRAAKTAKASKKV